MAKKKAPAKKAKIKKAVRKTRSKKAAPVLAEPAPPAPPAEPAPEPPAAPSRAVYAFPSRSRCPRCGSLNTLRVSGGTSHGGSLQYRQCQVTVCRRNYTSKGHLI